MHPFPKTGDSLRRSSLTRNALAFRRLTRESVEEALRRMSPLNVHANHVIIQQGERDADLFYLIETGRAEVWQQNPDEDRPRLVAELGTGDSFGEEALVTGGARSATVRMVEDSKLLALKKEDFRSLIASELIREVDCKMAAQLRNSGYLFLDVRYEEEFEESYIPGAKLIPLHELRQRIHELDYRTRYIAYCYSGKRSAVASMLLNQYNIQTVSLAGGIRDWPFDKALPL